MRYSIMLQLVTTISVIFVTAAALFAWIQNRQIEPNEEVGKNQRIDRILLVTIRPNSASQGRNLQPPHPIL